METDLIICYMLCVDSEDFTEKAGLIQHLETDLIICYRLCVDSEEFTEEAGLIQHLETNHPKSMYANAECQSILPGSQVQYPTKLIFTQQ